MWDGTDGIETGWAMANGLSAESQAPEAEGIGGLGPFPTKVGVNFDELLVVAGRPSRAQRRPSPLRACSPRTTRCPASNRR